MDIDHYINQDRAIEYLSGCLNEGTLVLFLGAGASSGAGLPDWPTLVLRMQIAVGLAAHAGVVSADILQRAADEVRRKVNDDKRFAEIVKESLYEGVGLEESLVYDNMLVAIGALMMGSRRGSVRRAVTLNFDSVLEYYLSLSGFVPRVVLQPPGDEGAEDVRIYHPHGFLPHPELHLTGSQFVILGSKSINERLGRPHDEWFSSVRHLLLTGICLFVGMSEHTFRDRAMAPLLANVASELRDRRPTGFWLLVGEYANIKALQDEFLEYNIVPIFLKDVPKFLLKICQRAGGTIRVSRVDQSTTQSPA